ncbi:MAG TPA: dienelactone hydrolase family protein [Terriglobales bacterium]|nr:dienelactone hydrolase family protein [Terriglobales bacterium]
MAQVTQAGLTRRQMLKSTGTAAAAAGYALSVETVLAQAIKTDTQGIVASDAVVKVGSHEMQVYEARPATGGNHPILLVVSEIWGVHEYIKDCTRRFAKEGFHAVAPELFQREGDVKAMPNVQDVLKIVLAVPREQMLGDVAAAVDWAKSRPNVRQDRVGVTGWCWGGSSTIHIAASNPDMKAAVAWYGPPARPYKGRNGDVTGFDVAKDVKIPFLGLFGETDQNPKPEDAKRFGELVRQAGNPHVEIVVYPDAPHGFHADYRPSYRAAAAADAWKRCNEWFKKHL